MMMVKILALLGHFALLASSSKPWRPWESAGGPGQGSHKQQRQQANNVQSTYRQTGPGERIKELNTRNVWPIYEDERPIVSHPWNREEEIVRKSENRYANARTRPNITEELNLQKPRQVYKENSSTTPNPWSREEEIVRKSENRHADAHAELNKLKKNDQGQTAFDFWRINEQADHKGQGFQNDAYKQQIRPRMENQKAQINTFKRPVKSSNTEQSLAALRAALKIGSSLQKDSDLQQDKGESVREKEEARNRADQDSLRKSAGLKNTVNADKKDVVKRSTNKKPIMEAAQRKLASESESKSESGSESESESEAEIESKVQDKKTNKVKITPKNDIQKEEARQSPQKSAAANRTSKNQKITIKGKNAGPKYQCPKDLRFSNAKRIEKELKDAKDDPNTLAKITLNYIGCLDGPKVNADLKEYVKSVLMAHATKLRLETNNKNKKISDKKIKALVSMLSVTNDACPLIIYSNSKLCEYIKKVKTRI